jgi:hypothetical protein
MWDSAEGIARTTQLDDAARFPHELRASRGFAG